MKTNTKTAPENLKTWQRTKTPGLLRHKSGRYYARFTLGGKTRFEALKTDLADIARIRFADAKARVERGRKAARNAANGAANMGELATALRQRIGARVGIAEHTRERNLEGVAFLEKTWDGFAKLRPAEVTASAVETWRDRALSTGTGFRPPGSKTPRKGASASSVNNALSALGRMLTLAADMGAVSANPLAGRRGLRASYKPRKPKLPEQAELEAVFVEMARVGGRGVPAAEFARVLALTGCRKGEAGALTIGDVDLRRGILRVEGTKTEGSRREVPLIPAARELLERILARHSTDGNTDPATPLLAVREAERSLTRACKVVGVSRLTHHDLRDAFATVCIEAAVDIPTVAGWLGHVDGGALLMRVYAHHRRAHSVAQAARVTFGGTT